MESIGADQGTVKKIVQQVTQILVRDETIQFVAVQQRKFVGLIPDAVVMTNRRLIVYKPSLLKAAFEDALWRDIEDTHMEESVLAAKLTFKFVDGKTIVAEHLSKEAARRAYAFAEEKEQEAIEVRRQRKMEEERAKVGGVIVGAGAASMPGVPAADGTMAKLTQLKALLDAQLITQEEYNKKKAEILGGL